MIALATLALALAGVPEGLRPMAAPPDVRERAAAAGLVPVCTAVVPERLQVCFRVWEEGRRRWIRSSDVARWNTTIPDLLATARVGGRARVSKLLEVQTVEGQPPGPASTYWMARDGDGWAASVLLDPEAVRNVAGGGRVRVAVPSAGVALVWSDPQTKGLTGPRGAELDHILSVAVREIHEAADDAVSPTVFVWNGDKLEPFATARARTPEGASADD